MPDSVAPVLRDHAVDFRVDACASDGGTEGDMETAIEMSTCSWSEFSCRLKSSSGAVIALEEREYSTTYSYVSGYHEGDGDMGGDVARPPDVSTHISAEVYLPRKDVVLEVPEFKRALQWLSGKHHLEDDAPGDVPSDYLVALASKALLAGETNAATVAKIREAVESYDTLDSVNDSKLLPVTDESNARQLISALPSRVKEGETVRLMVSAGLAAGLAELDAAAAAINKANTETKFANMANAAYARISLRLDALFEPKSAAPGLTPR